MGRTDLARWAVALGAAATWAAVGCSEESPGTNGTVPPGMVTGPIAPGAGTAASPTAGMAAPNVMMTGGSTAAGAAAQPPMSSGGAGGAMPPVTMAGAGAGAAGAAGMTPVNPMTPFMGPLDGDPAKPMVAIPNVPCGAPNISFAGAPAANMVKITNRDVLVAYPCAHEGAAVTFYLAIHGTLQEGQKIPFTLTNFPIHTKVDTDNFIVVAPQAIGTQWGNGDGGMDLPHLYEVIDWVYAQFGEKFSIRGMWASGGSWGSAYLSNFACDPMLEERLTGVRMIVGAGCPRCSSRLSCIVGEQELEEGGGMVLTDAGKEARVMASNIQPYADMHGCDAKTGPTDLGPVRAWTWPNCDPGWVHSYYLGPGQHADRWDNPTSVDHMVAEIKSADR